MSSSISITSQELADVILADKPYAISVLKRWIDTSLVDDTDAQDRSINRRSTSNRSRLEDISLGLLDEGYHQAFKYYTLALRYSDMRSSESIAAKMRQYDTSIAPQIYLDIETYSPANDEMSTILMLQSNQLLNKCLEERMMSKSQSPDDQHHSRLNARYLFEVLCETLNVDGVKMAFDYGQRPTYVCMDAVLDIAQSSKMNQSSGFRHIALTLCMEIIMCMESNGDEMDDAQRSRADILFDHGFTDDIDVIERAPQWSRECKITKGVASSRLRGLANDMGIDKSTSKESICTAITEFSHHPIGEIIKQSESSTKPYRIIPSDVPIKLSPRSSGCYNNTRKDISQYSPEGFIRYNGWCFTEDQYPDIITQRVVPNTGERIPQEVIQQMKDRVNQLNQGYGVKGTLNSIDKRVRGKDVKGQESYEKKLEQRFNVLIAKYGYDADPFTSLSPSGLRSLGREVFNTSLVSTLRGLINTTFDRLDRARQVYDISDYITYEADLLESLHRAVLELQ